MRAGVGWDSGRAITMSKKPTTPHNETYSDPLSAEEGLRLQRAFERIASRRIREQVIEFVERIANDPNLKDS
jgi:hypothetical protein